MPRDELFSRLSPNGGERSLSVPASHHPLRNESPTRGTEQHGNSSTTQTRYTHRYALKLTRIIELYLHATPHDSERPRHDDEILNTAPEATAQRLNTAPEATAQPPRRYPQQLGGVGGNDPRYPSPPRHPSAGYPSPPLPVTPQQLRGVRGNDPLTPQQGTPTPVPPPPSARVC